MPAQVFTRGRWLIVALTLALVGRGAAADEPSASAGDHRQAAAKTKPSDSPSIPVLEPTPKAEDASRNFSLSTAGKPSEEKVAEKTTVTTTEEPHLPISFSINYYLVSDYVFRGINFSEYGDEGRELPNHQMDTDLSVDIAALLGQEPGKYGSFGFGTFFEWYAGQKQLAETFDSERGGQNCQEVDYLIYWAYDIEPITTTFTVGYTWYAFPNAKSINTSEWWIQLDHNDAWMWKWLFPDNEDGVLNPYFFMAQDVDQADGGMWFELGISHEFEVFENFTLTPSWMVAIDHRWVDPIMGIGDGATQFAYHQIGLDATYDLTPLLHLPDWAGSVDISGFLYFNDALGNLEDNDRIQDEFFGGMRVGWSFGG